MTHNPTAIASGQLKIGGDHHSFPSAPKRWLARLGWIAMATAFLIPFAAHGQEVIKGVKQAEDLFRLPGTPWVVFSELADSAGPGDVRLLDIRAPHRTPLPFFPNHGVSTAGIDVRGLSPVGLNGHLLDGHGHYEVLLTNINKINGNGIFRFVLQLRGERPPQILHVEHIFAPAGTMMNSVAPLPDGGFVATNAYNMVDPTDFSVGLEQAEADFQQDIPTGSLWRWSPRTGWKRLVTPPSISWFDGVNVAPNGNYLFLNDGNGHRVWRLPLIGGAPSFVDLPLKLAPDNTKWDEYGQLTVAGVTGNGGVVRVRCSLSNECELPYAVISVDPSTLAAKVVMKSDDKLIKSTGFSASSVALWVNNKLLLSSFKGDRMLLLPKNSIQRNGEVSPIKKGW